MTNASCRRCNLRPRRMAQGQLDPLCEPCYRKALDKVAGELAAEAASDGRARMRRMGPPPGGRPAERPPERVAPVARVGARQPAGRRGGRRARVGDELLREARRLYALGLSLRAVAETLLAQTGYASVDSAEVALRAQFKRRGWPLRNRAQAQPRRRARSRDEKARAA